MGLLTVAVLLVTYGGLAIATVIRRSPQPPVALATPQWQQFADSCVGTFVARSGVAHPIILELAVTDTNGGTEITPEEHVDRLGVGQLIRFTIYETRCREIVAWRVQEQSRNPGDDPVHAARPVDD